MDPADGRYDPMTRFDGEYMTFKPRRVAAATSGFAYPTMSG